MLRKSKQLLGCSTSVKAYSVRQSYTALEMRDDDRDNAMKKNTLLILLFSNLDIAQHPVLILIIIIIILNYFEETWLHGFYHTASN